MSFSERLDKQDENVVRGVEILKECFETDFKPTRISQIIDGEKIQVKPDNILISETRDASVEIDEDLLDRRFEALCNLKPYSYQRATILKILELEQMGYHIDPITGKRMISNGWQIALPIGSGKSLCMEYLAIFHPNVPSHPIIVSGDGRSIPECEQLPFYHYPFYYERCAYLEGVDSTAIVYKNYTIRPITIILTHEHLLAQMNEYFNKDFKKGVIDNVKIGYVGAGKMNFNPDDFDILVVTADVSNVQRLVDLSLIKPFARVFIDDYTAMRDLSKMRQILTPSFIPVSGEGNDRDLSVVPASYYTMKNLPIDKITLVGDPTSTYEGVYRSNILTGELMGCSSDMDIYKFVNFINGYCQRNKSLNCGGIDDLFSAIAKYQTLEDYIRYGFFVQNFDLLHSGLARLREEIESNDLPSELAPNFSKWLKTTEDIKFRDAITKPGAIPVDQINSLVSSRCFICKREKSAHNGFGIISGCCGAFICDKCIPLASTEYITNSDTGEIIHSNDYFCCCCRAKSPHYYFNTTRESPTSPRYSFILAQEFFDVENSDKILPPDFYFYMLQYGFIISSPHRNGKPINIANDINSGFISGDVFEKGLEPEIRKIKAVDIIGSQLLRNLEYTFSKLGITPQSDSIIIIYRVKNEIRPGLEIEFSELRRNKNSPFYRTRLVFVGSLDEIIGLHTNVLGIIAWTEDEDAGKRHQLLGRIMRCSSFNNKLNFYISLNDNAYV